MFRNLAFDFRGDPDALNVNDQFMCGPSILVCPVTQPMICDSDSGADSSSAFTRDVYLPAGCEWYDFWSGERYDGGQRIAAACPLNWVPLFVRAGSVLPMAPEGAQSSQDALRADEWELRVFPGPDSLFEVYEDSGDGYGYEKDEFSFFSLEWVSSEEMLRVGGRSGNFPGVKSERKFRCVLHGESGCEKRLIFSGDKSLEVQWQGAC
jgi:alpha-D-xyloside xylohydrolase